MAEETTVEKTEVVETGKGKGKGKGKWGKYGGGMGSYYAKGNVWRSISQFIVLFLVIGGLTALILWLVYRPHKPKFSVIDAAVYQVNTSSPPMVSTTMQFTVVTRNPNDRVSIYYDRLSAFVTYKNQMITPPLMLPPLHQRKDSTVSMSPVLGGVAVPVSLEVANGLLMDMEGFGLVQLRLVLQGRVKWKAGAITTSHYDLYVTCDMVLAVKKGVVGQVPMLDGFHDEDQDHHTCDVDV